MSVDALDGLCALTFGSKEKFWEVAVLGKEIKKIIYERAPPGNIPPRSISARRNSKMDVFATIWKSLIRPLYSPEIDQGCTMRVSELVWGVTRRSELTKPEFRICKS